MTPESETRPAQCKPPAGPVFVVGMNGSGTTMLADSLGKHPELYMFPFEIRLLPYLLGQYERDGGDAAPLARRRLADALGRSKPVWQANGWANLQLSDDELGANGAAGAISAVFERLAAREGKRRWGEKSPMNVLHMQLLGEVFEGARFVHIVRDGRDAAQSFHRRFGYCPPETIYRWKRIIDKGRQQGQQLGRARYFELSYENLTSDPEHWMREICSFLDLPFHAAVLSSSMKMVDPARAAGRQAIISNSGQWQHYFTPAEVRRLEAIAGRQLQALGYQVQLAGDRNPSSIQRGWWRVLGTARFTVGYFKQWGWSGLPGYLRSLLVSAKQSSTGRD
jgi:hypothetical protein